MKRRWLLLALSATVMAGAAVLGQPRQGKPVAAKGPASDPGYVPTGSIVIPPPPPPPPDPVPMGMRRARSTVATHKGGWNPVVVRVSTKELLGADKKYEVTYTVTNAGGTTIGDANTVVHPDSAVGFKVKKDQQFGVFTVYTHPVKTGSQGGGAPYTVVMKIFPKGEQRYSITDKLVVTEDHTYETP